MPVPAASASVSKSARLSLCLPKLPILSAMFEENRANVPLAERLRPRTIDEVLGQKHLLGPNKPLRVAFESGEAHSMILWGPPGVGRPTLARLMGAAFHAEFISLSAVLSGVKDIREAVELAQIHRANGHQTLGFVEGC